MGRFDKKLTLNAYRISGIYIILASLWIGLSDYIINNVELGGAIFLNPETIKGWLFVWVTGVLLYYLIRRSNTEISKNQAELSQIFDQSMAGIAYLDNHSWIRINPRFVALTGYQLDELADLKFMDLIETGYRNPVADEWESIKNGKQKYFESEVKLQKKDASSFWVFLSISKINGNFDTRYFISIRDISDKKRYQQYSKVLSDIILSIEPTQNLKETLYVTIKEICRYLGWNFGEAWIPSEDRQCFERLVSWHSHGKRYEIFEQKSDQISFFMDDGMPGWTFKEQYPLWWEDISKDQRYKRMDLAREAGLKTAASMPIIVDGTLVAILLLMKSEVEEKDDEILKFLSAISEDITIKIGHQKEQDARKVSEESLNFALESASMASWDIDFETNRVIRSKNHDKLFGNKEDFDEWGIEIFLDHVHPNDRDRVQGALQDALVNKSKYSEEFRVIWPDDSIHWLWSRGKVYFDHENEPVRISGIIQDITARKRTLYELQRYKKRMESAQELGKLGYWEYIPETGEVRWTDMVYKLFGVDKKEFSPTLQKLLDFVHPDDIEDLVEAQLQARSMGETMEITYRIIRPDRSITYLQERGKMRYDPYDEREKFTGIVIDVTNLKMTEQELKKSNQLTESILETADIGICVTNDDGIFVNVNNEYCDIYGYEPDELIGEQFTKVLPGDGREFGRDIYKKFLEGTLKNAPREWEAKRKDGHLIEILVSSALLVTDNERFQVTTVLDITEQRRAERKLKESELKYRLLFEQNPLPMFIYDPSDLHFVDLNEAAVVNYGYTKEELKNMAVTDLHPSDEMQTLNGHIEQSKNGYSHTKGWTHIKKDGTRIKVEIISTNVVYEGQEYRMVLANDITGQVRAEKRVLKSVIKGEDRERKRIAKELHDGLGQYLTASKLNLDYVKKGINQLGDKQIEKFETGLGLLKEALDETRSISYNLMPKALEDYGLILALESLIKRYERSGNIMVNFIQNANEELLDSQLQINLYRITQELLNNALKHSGGDRIELQIMHYPNEILYTYEDNGRGFDVEQAENKSPGLGMGSIKTRVNSMSGELQIDSRINRGTFISIEIPINDI